MTTDFKIDFVKFPKLAGIFEKRPRANVYWLEMVQLLRDARADSVKFIQDVKAEELKKAFDKGKASVFQHVEDPEELRAHLEHRCARAAASMPWTTTVPLTSAEIASTFSNQINMLQGPNTVPGIISVDSSFVLNGLLQTDMPDPTPEMLDADPLFDAIWNMIKLWDGVNGSHVALIYSAVGEVIAKQVEEAFKKGLEEGRHQGSRGILGET